MKTLIRYRKMKDKLITAICLNLDTDGIKYNKWGSIQHGKPGDWIVENNGDIYTVDMDSFNKSYKEISPGRFLKITPVWACVATDDGSIKTKEGHSYYKTGDYLVYNNRDKTDGYCMSAEKFNSMYELDE